MKYTTEVIVNLPREELIKKLDKPENMKHWQRGLLGYKQLTPETPGQVGAKMELEYKRGKKSMMLTETIVKNDFPAEFHATYDAGGVHNIQQNYFEVLDANTTKWRSESEFQFSNFMMKAIGFLMPGVFKKQSQKYLNDFKAYAEEGVSVSETI